MYSGFRMVIDDPSKIDLISSDMKSLMLRAAKNTVNMQAALTRRNALENIQQFTLRNTFTKRQIQYTPCQDENPQSFSQIQSHVGATEKAPYMERQEKGGIHSNPNGGPVAIPTVQARGGSIKSPVQRKMYRSKIQPKIIKYNPTSASTPASALVKAARQAYQTKGFLKYNKNIYKIVSFSKTGDKVNFELEMIYFRGLTSTVTKQAPWLQPASLKPAQDGQAIFNSQIEKLDK